MDAVTETAEVATVYPAWQAKIRAAQDVTEAKINEELAEEEVQKQQKNIEEGKLLQRVLAMFGIEAEPAENTFVLDNIAFRLRNIGSSWGGEVYLDENLDKFRFNLGVWYVLPERYQEEYSFDYHAPISDHVDVGWTHEVSESHLSQLAYAIDRVTENAESFMKQTDARTLQLKDAPAPAPPSTAEQLVTLIRQIIREEAAESETW